MFCLSPPSTHGFGFRAKEPFALFQADLGLAVMLLRGQVVNPLAVPADVALDGALREPGALTEQRIWLRSDLARKPLTTAPLPGRNETAPPSTLLLFACLTLF